MNYRLTFAAAALMAAAFPAVAAAADTKFVVSGDYNASWILPETVDLQTASAQGFAIDGIAGTFPGSALGNAYIDFYSAANGGGLMISDSNSFDILAILTSGEQLYNGTYSGPSGSPVWKTGTFAFKGDQGVGSYNLKISEVTAAVPEPSTWAMAIIGMGLVGAALRRRRARVNVRFA